jgi:hypothetical protein
VLEALRSRQPHLGARCQLHDNPSAHVTEHAIELLDAADLAAGKTDRDLADYRAVALTEQCVEAVAGVLLGDGERTLEPIA